MTDFFIHVSGSSKVKIRILLDIAVTLSDTVGCRNNREALPDFRFLFAHFPIEIQRKEGGRRMKWFCAIPELKTFLFSEEVKAMARCGRGERGWVAPYTFSTSYTPAVNIYRTVFTVELYKFAQ